MKQIILRKGQIFVEDVPAPTPMPGYILVRVLYSCISPGTELAGVRASGKPLWRRVIEQPEKIKKALIKMKSAGILNTVNVAKTAVGLDFPLGYSVAGEVIDSGGIGDFPVGTKVAVGGGECAFHAEIISVPKNLAVMVPDDVSMKEACTTTIGAIAMQGLRRLNPSLGEMFVVIGLGAIGQLTSQILKANGCKVIVFDIDGSRSNLALQLGADFEVTSPGQVEQVVRLTSGNGADGVVICAAAKSDEIVSEAFGMCRKKGRVVLVGDVGLNIKRSDIYSKELDFFISSSYGPGRYDERYEEKGLDYPISYVRWTENRNMSAYVDLLANNKIRVEELITAQKDINSAPQLYENLDKGEILAVLKYPREEKEQRSSVVRNVFVSSVKEGRIGISVIGAGQFVQSSHMENLKKHSGIASIRGVMARRGHNASSVSKRFGAEYATTDVEEILTDDLTHVVIIGTRHDLHVKYALMALRAGKHVLVEKPLAINNEELKEITDFYKENESPVLLTGFNRRFSPFALRIKAIISNRKSPLMINYRMNAGYMAADSWVQGPEGGGRNIGEACHVYDLFTYIIDSSVISVNASSVNDASGYYANNDNFTAAVTFKDGSVANLFYTAMGTAEKPKERMEVFCEGAIIELDDYKTMRVYGIKEKGVNLRSQDKGLVREMEEFCNVVKNGGEWPIPFWQQIQATEISMRVEEMLSGGSC